MNYFNVFKNHWKKISFASACLSYGVYAAKSHYEVSVHMRNVCNDVVKISNSSNGVPKNILVVMNPAAKEKKCEKTFKKYCEPILHLAGYTVEIFKTSYVGHAKSFIESLQIMPDAIVVAGGDGTSSEVVTGLMRRDDTPCPIVLLPLGSRNETALKYAEFKPTNDAELLKILPTTLLPLVKENSRYINVIRFDVIETEELNNEKSLKPIYGLDKFSWGLLKDIDALKDKYWYLGYLKHQAAALFNSFSDNLNWNFSADFVYTPPCSGCSNCAIPERQTKAPSSFLSKFMPVSKTRSVNMMHIKNDNCSKQIKGHISTSQLSIACNQNEDFYELETKCIESLNPGLDVIKNLSKITHHDFEPSVVLKSRTIELIPNSDVKSNSSYSIDGEEYDIRPIKVSIVPNAIKVYG